MERVKKTKARLTLDNIFFSTPEQKLLRFLISQPTTTFTPRVLSSKLKGVRGLGGVEGITRILKQLEEVGLVQFVNNGRGVCLRDDHTAIKMMKSFCALCDLEGLRDLVEPVSSHGVLFGTRATGDCSSDSEYELFIASDQSLQVKKMVESHPLGRRIELTVWSQDDYLQIERKDPDLAKKLVEGIVMWGTSW